jgi:hypothetical protein
MASFSTSLTTAGWAPKSEPFVVAERCHRRTHDGLARMLGGSAGNVLGDVDCVRLKIPCAQIDGEKRLKKLGLPVIVEGAH